MMANHTKKHFGKIQRAVLCFLWGPKIKLTTKKKGGGIRTPARTLGTIVTCLCKVSSHKPHKMARVSPILFLVPLPLSIGINAHCSIPPVSMHNAVRYVPSSSSVASPHRSNSATHLPHSLLYGLFFVCPARLLLWKP
jgi:hypothetical protein